MLSQLVKRKNVVALLKVALVIGIAVIGYYAYINVVTERDMVRLYPEGPESYLDTGQYAIDPKTILSDLDSGETNVFTPMLATPETSLPSGLFPWHQADYLKIASAVYDTKWKESLEDWRLYQLQFIRECQDNPNGFDFGVMTYFKTIEMNGKQEYTARGIGIYPLYNQVDWGGGTTYPHYSLLGWRAYDLEKLKITADDALAMAEQNGAKESRFKVKNACRLSVNLLSDGWWHVEYHDNEGATIYSMIIEPYTGKYIVLKSSK